MFVVLPVCRPSEEIKGLTQFFRQSIYVNPSNIESVGTVLIDERRGNSGTFTSITFTSGDVVYSLETPAEVISRLSSRNMQCRKRKPATSKTASTFVTQRLKNKA